MNKIKIQENDILWYFYKRFYELSGEKYKSPTSLCPYFWTAVFGMLLTCLMVPPLVINWIVGLSVAVTSVCALTYVPLLGKGVMANTVLMSSIIMLLISLIPLFVVTGKRLEGKFQIWYKRFWTSVLLMASFILIIISFIAMYDIVVTHGWSQLILTLLVGGIFVVGVVLAAAGIGFVATKIWTPFSVSRLFFMLGSMFKAVKNRACPLVEVDPNLEDNFRSNRS